MSKRARNKTIGALVLGLALMAFPVASVAEEQVGIVLEKDVEAKTLTLEGGVVLHVSPRTVMTGASGQRISFADLPHAEFRDGGYAVSGDEGILYEASGSERKLNASRIQLLGTIPD